MSVRHSPVFISQSEQIKTKELPKPTAFKPRQISEERLFSLVNDWKNQQYGYKYIESEELCGYALVRAQEIKQDWSHNKFLERFHNFRVEISENLSKDAVSETDTLYFWLKSDSHREALEKPFTHSCIKCDDNYCVQLFANL